MWACWRMPVGYACQWDFSSRLLLYGVVPDGYAGRLLAVCDGAWGKAARVMV